MSEWRSLGQLLDDTGYGAEPVQPWERTVPTPPVWPAAAASTDDLEQVPRKSTQRVVSWKATCFRDQSP